MGPRPPVDGYDVMSFTLTIQCPRHLNYQGKVRPSTDCKCCGLMFSVRNETHKVLSVPREERTDVNEMIIRSLE